MKVQSKEYLDRLWEEAQLINLTLRHIQQNKQMLILEHGLQPMQAVDNDLRNEKLKLTMKAEALNAFLTE